MTTIDCLVHYQVRLRVAYTIVDPGEQAIARILDEVLLENSRNRMEGLEDVLDPYILHPGKIEAFLVGLAQQPVQTWEALRNRVLYLAAPELYLRAATPVTVECISQGFSLTVPDEAPGSTILAVLHCSIDPDYAQDLSVRARTATEGFNKEVERLEFELGSVDSLADPVGYSVLMREFSQARFKRCSVSMTWRDSSTAQARANPRNRALTRAAREAERVALQYLMPPRTGMPSPG